MKPAAAKLMIAAATISAFGSASALATDGNCTYHGITYSDGAMICVGPNYGQVCDKGTWSTFQRETYKPAGQQLNPPPSFTEACKNATSATTDK